MAVQKFFEKEITLVKEKLINTSLVVAFVSGIPLLIFSIIRSLQFGQIGFVIVNSVVFVLLTILAIYRKRIHFQYKAIFMVALIVILAITDFANVGVLSTAYMWLIAAAVVGFLYFDVRAALIIIIASVVISIISAVLIFSGVFKYSFDFNEYAYSKIIMLIRTLNYLVITLVIVFSIRQITRKFDMNLERLALQRQNLMNSAIRMKKEIDQRMITEKNAVDSERKFRNIFESSADPIVIIGKDWLIKDCNQAFYQIVEEDDNELIGSSLYELLPKDYIDYFNQFKGDITSLPPQFEMRYQSRLSGKKRYFDIKVTNVEYEDDVAIMAIVRDDTDKKIREQLIYSAAMEGEERERLRLSKELHDGLGPLLSTLKIYYEAMEKRPDDMEIQKRIKNILNDSISSVKEISNNLSPYVLQNLGVSKALKAFTDKLVFAGKLAIELETNVEERLDEKIEITVYRLVTEMLNNTLKHARAKNVNIQLKQLNQTLSVYYHDDGVGFDATGIQNNTSGIGLFNMKSRIEKMGGSCEFISSPGDGFHMNAQMPLMTNVTYYG